MISSTQNERTTIIIISSIVCIMLMHMHLMQFWCKLPVFQKNPTLYPDEVSPAFRFAKTHFILRKKDLSISTVWYGWCMWWWLYEWCCVGWWWWLCPFGMGDPFVVLPGTPAVCGGIWTFPLGFWPLFGINGGLFGPNVLGCNASIDAISSWSKLWMYS